MHDLSQFLAISDNLQELTGQVYKPLLAVLGPFNAGKSTLINGLLGCQASPVGIMPTTSRPVYFDYGSSFKATVYDRRKETFLRPADLYSFLAADRACGGRVEIEIPSPILKKCRLLDTPGIDSPDRESLNISREAAKKADKIIYLFHQRGIDQVSRLFLYELATCWKTKQLDHLSFWLNCNLGRSDGASLETTRAALREIFLFPVKIYAINTAVRENIETLRLFLEVRLAKENFRQAAVEIRKIDAGLPRKLKKIDSIKNETLFLDGFWEIQQVSRTILEAGRLIHAAPSFVRELDHRLAGMSAANLAAVEKRAGGAAYRPRPQTIRGNRKIIEGLIGQLANDPVVKDYIDQRKLAQIRRLITSERFTAVVAGGFSTGKSTFINALLKDDLLPAADGPTTSVVTRITQGDVKKAIVRTPLQTTVRIYEQVGNKAVLNGAALEALERWMTADGSAISQLEALIDGNFEVVDRRRAAGLIKNTREVFAAGAFAATGRTSPPSIYRRLPVKALRGKGAPQKIRVTFQNPGAREYNIQEPQALRAFRDAQGPDWAFRIEEVEIQHPAEFLELATLVDTPGLDWIHAHHHKKISLAIKNSDACLVFLNARHILNNVERDNFASLFQLRETGHEVKRGLLGNSERFFYVISFADTLSAAQREAVYNYVMGFLKKTTGPKIFMISGLKGLNGTESGIKGLLKSLEQVILKYRGREFFLDRLDDLYDMLEAATEKINGLSQPGEPAPGERTLRAALKGLREYRLLVKSARNTVYETGRFEISGKRETFGRAAEEDYTRDRHPDRRGN